MAWKLYTDAACTVEFGGTLSFVHFTDFSDNPQDRVLYFADVERDPANNQAYRLIRSDGSDIIMSITDATPGAGHLPSELRLATTLAGLDTALPGADLNLGTELLSGLSALTEIHIRVTNAIAAVSTEIDLGVQINECVVRAAT